MRCGGGETQGESTLSQLNIRQAMWMVFHLNKGSSNLFLCISSILRCLQIQRKDLFLDLTLLIAFGQDWASRKLKISLVFKLQPLDSNIKICWFFFSIQAKIITYKWRKTWNNPQPPQLNTVSPICQAISVTVLSFWYYQTMPALMLSYTAKCWFLKHISECISKTVNNSSNWRQNIWI